LLRWKRLVAKAESGPKGPHVNGPAGKRFGGGRIDGVPRRLDRVALSVEY